VKRIQADEVLSRFLGTLDLAQDQYLIEAGGKAIAGVVPAWELETPDERRQAILGMLEEVWARTQGVPESVVERDVQEAAQVVRTRRRQAE
jgi:hypothetical protein